MIVARAKFFSVSSGLENNGTLSLPIEVAGNGYIEVIIRSYLPPQVSVMI